MHRGEFLEISFFFIPLFVGLGLIPVFAENIVQDVKYVMDRVNITVNATGFINATTIYTSPGGLLTHDEEGLRNYTFYRTSTTAPFEVDWINVTNAHINFTVTTPSLSDVRLNVTGDELGLVLIDGIDTPFTFDGVNFIEVDTGLIIELIFNDTGGDSSTENFTDELAIEDSIGTIGGFITSFTDELGIEDSLGTISGFIISFTDEMAIEDSLGIISGNTISFTDELAIEDSFDFMSANTINLLDELAIEDILAEDSNFIISFTDELGIEDSIGVIRGTIIPFTDELGIEDSIGFELSVIYFTDELAIEDTLGTIEPIDAVFNALVITLNPAQNTTLGGSFAILCPSNSTLTGLFINGTFRCTPMSEFFP